jgi:8-hydroxy-5-deazaflavin:NADPH oxidoreductase
MSGMRIGIVGGTGALGSGLALRCAAAGHHVVIGTRDPGRAADTVASLLAQLGSHAGAIEAAENATAAASVDIVIVAVRFGNQRETLAAIRDAVQGKIVVDTSVPLVPPKVMRVQLPEAGSAAQIAQDVLGEGVRVVSAFQNVAAHHLAAMGEVPCDVLVSGDDREARTVVVELARSIGINALHAGALCNAAAAEALTSILIFLNKENKTHSGIRITGLDRPEGH